MILNKIIELLEEITNELKKGCNCVFDCKCYKKHQLCKENASLQCITEQDSCAISSDPKLDHRANHEQAQLHHKANYEHKKALASAMAYHAQMLGKAWGKEDQKEHAQIHISALSKITAELGLFKMS